MPLESEPRPRRPASSDEAALDERLLVALLLAGDERATRQAWDHFSPLVRRILRRALGPSGDVEDSVQEVFLRFFERIGSLRDSAALRSYLVAITVNTLRGELRRRRVRRIVHFVDPSEVPELRVVDADPEAREALTRFYRILDRLRPNDRIAFVLRAIEGLPLAEIAATLEVSVPTVRRRIARAKTRLLHHIQRDPLLSTYAARGAGAVP